MYGTGGITGRAESRDEQNQGTSGITELGYRRDGRNQGTSGITELFIVDRCDERNNGTSGTSGRADHGTCHTWEQNTWSKQDKETLKYLYMHIKKMHSTEKDNSPGGGVLARTSDSILAAHHKGCRR